MSKMKCGCGTFIHAANITLSVPTFIALCVCEIVNFRKEKESFGMSFVMVIK